MKKLIDISKLKPSKLVQQNRYVNKRSQDTGPEIKVQKLLDDLGIKYQKQFQLEKVFYDLFVPTLNLLIEVDGIWWHAKNINYTLMNRQQRKTFKRDKYKDGLATKHGHKLARIWEDEITKQSVKKLLK